LAREAPFPAAIADCRCAVRWLRAHAKEHNVDPERIGVWGNSAGGHLALMLALTNEKSGIPDEGPWQEQSSRVHAAASDSGPLDLEFQYRDGVLRGAVELFLAGPPDEKRIANYRQASPTTYVANASVPLLMIYGVADVQVPVATADRFVEALNKAGLKDLSYHRLAAVDHCPHSMQRVKWLEPVVNEFFIRTLKRDRR
ncbi:MAG: prolyl oligopeptidase family serine peptidase, partial [Planctomycetaceae bacterium]